MATVVEKIAAATGVDRDWLMWGSAPDPTLGGAKGAYISSPATYGSSTDTQSLQAA